MKNDLVMSMTMNDLVFSGRNKSYGAYLLRKTYDNNMTKGIFFGVGIFLLFITSPMFDNDNNRGLIPPIVDEKYDTTVLHLRPKPIFESLSSAGSTPTLSKKSKSEVFRVVTDDEKIIEVDEKPTTINEDPSLNSSTNTDSGTSEGANQGSSTTQGTGIIDETPVTNVEDFTAYAEEMPEFPGGNSALYKYLNKKVRYPEIAFQNGIEGTVLVQFVVDREGNINRTNVVRKLGGGCDEEAVRVIAEMPKWKPGKMGGKNVSVIFSLPIRFKIEKTR